MMAVEDVAVALNEQYQPRFAGDALPSNPVACALVIADKMDTLAGIFGTRLSNVVAGHPNKETHTHGSQRYDWVVRIGGTCHTIIQSLISFSR